MQSQYQSHDPQQMLQGALAKYHALCKYGNLQVQQAESYYSHVFSESTKRIERLTAAGPLPTTAGWSDQRWLSWDGSPVPNQSLIRVGDMTESWVNGLCIPGYVPLIGGKKTIIIRCDSATSLQGLGLLQSLIIRTVTMLPHQSRYTLLDPSTNGRAFPMRRDLPRVRENSGEEYRDLEGVQNDIDRIITTYFNEETPSFELIAQENRLNEPFQFVFAAHFPDQYDRRTIEKLQKIGKSGPFYAGVYLFIHLNTEHEFPREMNKDVYIRSFGNTFEIDLSNPGSLTKLGLSLRVDSAPPPDVQRHIFTILSKSKSQELPLPWESLVGIPEREWWQEDASEIVETPIGKRGSGDKSRIGFGKRGRQAIAHGILGAMTGAGKSTLFHVLINGFAIRYSPRELRLYLIDGKYGVEFRPYRRLPHAEVVSLHSPPELSRSVLTELIAEMGRRNDLISRAGVDNLTQYRSQGQPFGNLPRILLLIDEYQQLFEDDKEGAASACLRQLAEKGRSAGIHMLLASQHFGTPGMLYREQIFNNIHLRMAMTMTRSNIQSLTEFGPKGRALIANCNAPGKIVVNDSGGDDEANQDGKVAYLDRVERDRVLQKLIGKAETLPREALPQTVVFDGTEQPVLCENPRFTYFLHRPIWLTQEELKQHARLALAEGGMGISDWNAFEHPHIAWLGQEFNVRGHAAIVFRRNDSENAVLIGRSSAVRYGMLTSIIASLCVVSSPKEIRFHIADFSRPDTLESPILQTVHASLLQAAGYSCTLTKEARDVEKAIDDLISQLENRLNEQKELVTLPSVFVIMTELDRVQQLRRTAASYGLVESPLGLKLRRLLSDGPSHGIHLILSFSSSQTFSNVVDGHHSLPLIRHRVALQMNEDDSFKLVGSGGASKLQAEGEEANTPVCALYADRENNSATRFKPYTIEPARDPSPDSSKEPLMEQVASIGKILARRSRER